MADRSSPLFRYTNAAVGALVLIVFVVFIAAVLESARLRGWFEPGAKLKVILPPEGLFGLTEGAQVMILGTDAGEVSQIVVEKNQQIHAIVTLNRKMMDFVRRDSEAIIRKQFGVAGASFLEISRGTGEPLDWQYAVINATAEAAPTESIGEMIADVREKVLPILDDTKRLLTNLNAITGKIAAGEGALGRLLADDRLALQLEALLAQVNAEVEKLAPLLSSLQTTAAHTTVISKNIAQLSGDLPQVVRSAKNMLASLQSVTKDLSRTTPHLPKMIENADEAMTNLPVLLLQTQQTVYELEMLLKQLRSNWLLGGEKTEQAPRGRISPTEVPR